MWTSVSKRTSVTAAVAAAAALTILPSAGAAADPLVFPAGTACTFGLRVDSVDPAHRVERTFKDANGNPVRVLSAGVGSARTFTNLTTGASLATSANGSVIRTVNNPDGTQTVTATGHTILILFPTDVPAGPTTTLIVGRLVFTVDPATGVFTRVSTSGNTTDICAALS